jgi:tRNA pseudouridine13 synthase
MSLDPSEPLPLLTADMPGIGGRIRDRLEDFEVEEIPVYPACGNGDFLFLWVEKKGVGAEYFLQQVARRLHIRPGDVGVAGLKDRWAITRQMVSVPEHCESQLPALEGDGIRLLSVNRHSNKLRSGHLKGNRFRIVIRDPNIDALKNLDVLLERLRQHGMPNYYGPQRFGRDGETARTGLSVLRREKVHLKPFLRKLALSAVQSLLFNDYLARRLRDGLLHRILLGDVLSKRATGGLFVGEDQEREQQRFNAGETVPTGPIFGRKMMPARAEAGEREAAILADAKIEQEAFQGFGKLLQGTRRHTLIFPDQLTSQLDQGAVRLDFTLPAGAYATVLLREVMKESDMEAGPSSTDTVESF